MGIHEADRAGNRYKMADRATRSAAAAALPAAAVRSTGEECAVIEREELAISLHVERSGESIGALTVVSAFRHPRGA